MTDKDRIEADTPTEGVDSKTEKSDLVNVPGFREYQANRDRQFEKERLENKRLSDELAKLTQSREREERRARELEELGKRDPTAIVEYFHGKEDQVGKTSQVKAEISARAYKMLEDYGIEATNEGLDWGSGPSPETFAAFTESVLKIVAERDKQEATQSTRGAEIEALKRAGVTKIGTVLGQPSANENPIEDITDTSTLYQMSRGK